MTAKLELGKATHPGRKSAQNEDAHELFTAGLRIPHAARLRTLQVAVIADGMSGQPAGLTASTLAIKSIQEVFKQESDIEIVDRMKKAIREANSNIYFNALNKPDSRGMGTTVVMAVIDHDQLYVAHVGDSRAYLVRAGTAYPLTRDHTRVQDLVVDGRLSAAEARNHPERNQLSRRLGLRQMVDVDVTMVEPGTQDSLTTVLSLQRGDTLLLCTDGLTEELPDETIERVVSSLHPQRAADRLVELANENGGRDNITVILLQWPTRTRIVRWLLQGALLLTILLLLAVLSNYIIYDVRRPLPPEITETATAATAPTTTETLLPTPSITEDNPGNAPITPTVPTETPVATPTLTETATTPPTKTPEPTPTRKSLITVTPRATATKVEPSPVVTATLAISPTPTATVTIEPCPVIDGMLPPIIMAPASGQTITSGDNVEFRWRWTGQLPACLGFEVKALIDGQWLGLDNANETAKTPAISTGEYVDTIRIVRQPGELLWSVAVVQLEIEGRNYEERLRSEPHLLKIRATGGGRQ